METTQQRAGNRRRRLARRFLQLICGAYLLLLFVFSYYPSLLHTPVFTGSLSLGIPLAFVFIMTVFALMIYFILRGGSD